MQQYIFNKAINQAECVQRSWSYFFHRVIIILQILFCFINRLKLNWGSPENPAAISASQIILFKSWNVNSGKMTFWITYFLFAF